MKKRFGRGAGFALALALAMILVACAPAEQTEESKTMLQAVKLSGDLFVVTDEGPYNGLNHNLIVLLCAGEMKEAPVGSAGAFAIGDLMESYPLQAVVEREHRTNDGPARLTLSLDEVADWPAYDAAIRLIDVRTPAEFAGGHVEGALNVPLDELAARIEAAAPDKNAPVIVYCRSGSRSADAAGRLLDMGYAVVIDAGGILDYKRT